MFVIYRADSMRVGPDVYDHRHVFPMMMPVINHCPSHVRESVTLPSYYMCSSMHLPINWEWINA